MEKYAITVEKILYLKFAISGSEIDYEHVENLEEATTWPDFLSPQKILNSFERFGLTKLYEFDIITIK